VLCFLGKKLTLAGGVPGNLTQQVITDLRQRQEGVRIKHAVGRNSVKLYDKLYTPTAAVLRLEATINEPKDFLVYRRKREMPKGRDRGEPCGEVLPTSIVALSFPKRLWIARPMP
jgi:hypothetical protein